MLSGESIRKGYGGVEILHGITISVNPGEITAILGPSGGGKSTLLRTLSLLDSPDCGTITCDDRHYHFPHPLKNGVRPPWPELTVVFQQLFLWPHLTLRQNIMLPLEQLRARGPVRGPLPSNREVNNLLDLFELIDLADRYPNEASLGQRQRVALVRALVLRPTYLLLDEITSALDVEHVSRVLEYLRLLRAEGVGILLVTHLVGFAKSAADQIVFMDNGSILESGGSALLTAPRNERFRTFLSLVETAV